MFFPDYNNISDCALNKKPERIPLYEHYISDRIMERLLGTEFCHLYNTDIEGYYKNYNNFYKCYGYDTVTFEGCITEVLPCGGALAHPQKGHIDSAVKFKSYPFQSVRDLYIQRFDRDFKALKNNMPEGMKAIGGVGNGIFEIVQDLAGFENLCIMSFEEPGLYEDLFIKAGDMMEEIWKWFLENHGDAFCVCRFGDDLGFKTNTMLSTEDIKRHIIPQYKRIINLIHKHNKPFLLHSCGCIFSVMDDLIEDAKIDAKHSNEEQIAPMKVWVEKYGNRIANFGGIDTDALVRMDNERLFEYVREIYELAAAKDGGFAIGSGNSIPHYVDEGKYLLMINTVRELRGE